MTSYFAIDVSRNNCFIDVTVDMKRAVVELI